jgi:hypothetical protein
MYDRVCRLKSLFNQWMELKMKVMWKSVLVLAVAMQFCAVACDDPKLSSWADNVWMVQIVVDPMKNQYEIGDVVTLSYVVLDRYGQQIDGIGATWENPAAQDVLAHGNQQFEFIKVGAFTWKVTLEPPFELSDSVTLNVPQIPSRVEITVDPDRPSYVVGNQVALGCLVRDQYDDIMNGIDVTWQNPAPGGIQDDGNQQFTFTQEGQFTWICSLTADPAINDTRTLTVDGTGPVVVFEVPERGDTILKSGPDAQITVSGTVTDVPSGVNRITIHTNAMGDTVVTPGAGGSFSLVTPAVPGLNVVVAEAEDSVGNISTTTRAYHYSSDFFDYRPVRMQRDQGRGLPAGAGGQQRGFHLGAARPELPIPAGRRAMAVRHQRRHIRQGPHRRRPRSGFFISGNRAGPGQGGAA